MEQQRAAVYTIVNSYKNTKCHTLQNAIDYLLQIEGDRNPIVVPPIGDRGTLPPPVSPIDGVSDGVSVPLPRRIGDTSEADAALDLIPWSSLNVLHQLTELFRTVLSTGGVARDLGH